MSVMQLNEEVYIDDDDRRFNKILFWVFALFLAFSIALPFFPVFEIDRKKNEKIPPRIAKVLMEKKIKPVPIPPVPTTKKPEPKSEPKKKKPEQRKEVVKKPPKVKQKKSVQERVAKVGLLALRSQLTELKEDPILNRITHKNQKLTKNVRHSTRPTVASVAKNATKGSGGIDTSKLSKKTTQTALASRTLTEVSTHITTGGDDRKLGKENVKGRSLESIRLVIERVKGSLQTLYMRQLRQTPGIQGTVLFDFTIDPSGKVVSCVIVESELNSSRLERKFVIKLKSIDFGEEDVDEVLIRYPLDFLPSLSGN